MSSYDNEHWDWIRGLISQTEAPATTPAPIPQPTPATPEAIETAGSSVYAVTLMDDGLASYQPIQGMWR